VRPCRKSQGEGGWVGEEKKGQACDCLPAYLCRKCACLLVRLCRCCCAGVLAAAASRIMKNEEEETPEIANQEERRRRSAAARSIIISHRYHLSYPIHTSPHNIPPLPIYLKAGNADDATGPLPAAAGAGARGRGVHGRKRKKGVAACAPVPCSCGGVRLPEEATDHTNTLCPAAPAAAYTVVCMCVRAFVAWGVLLRWCACVCVEATCPRSLLAPHGTNHHASSTSHTHRIVALFIGLDAVHTPPHSPTSLLALFPAPSFSWRAFCGVVAGSCVCGQDRATPILFLLIIAHAEKDTHTRAWRHASSPLASNDKTPLTPSIPPSLPPSLPSQQPCPRSTAGGSPGKTKPCGSKRRS